MDSNHILIFDETAGTFPKIISSLPGDVTAAYATTGSDLVTALDGQAVDAVVLVLSSKALDADLHALRSRLEHIPLILMVEDGGVSPATLNDLIGLPLQGVLPLPFSAEEFNALLEQSLTAREMLSQGKEISEALTETNRRLNARLQEINTVYTVGKSVASSLDIDEVLARVVMASVNITQAEDGVIILKEGDRLFVRVSKRMEHRFPQRLHDATTDSVAWQVIRSGRPAMLHRETKIATGLVVRSLLYVPLQTPGADTIGILGVVNRLKDARFTEHQLFTLSSIADFAAIALENARLFSAVEAERSRLGAILENAVEAIIVTDAADRLWLWSETAAEIFGLDSDARGQSVGACIDYSDVRELFDKTLQEEAMVHAEVELRDGRVYNAQLTTVPDVGRVAVMQEITHLKELDRLKSEFVSTVSHDLRTPLTTIQGYVELLDRVGPLNERQTDFVNRALSSLNHITDLISDLLDIGRIEAGYDLEMKALRMDELVRTTAEAAVVQAQSQGMGISVDLPDGPLWTWGNARRLRQVLDNLISNALKYNRPEGWVGVRAECDDEHIVVSVSDSGIGISAEDQAQIFERFYRVQSPETEDVQGTGLGLAIVKSVVEKHKGRVWVESTLGEGSTFAFLLPLTNPPA
jgi:two-component system NtrC family sensor kinase